MARRLAFTSRDESRHAPTVLMGEGMRDRDRLKEELIVIARQLFVDGHVEADEFEQMLDVVGAGRGFVTLPVKPYWRECALDEVPLSDSEPLFGSSEMGTILR